MEILKGKVQDPGFPDTEVTYLKTDDGKTYFFIENGTLKNGNIISTPILKEGIGHAPYTSLGLIDKDGNVLIPFENKNIKALSDDLLLVEKAKPTTQSVVDAASKQTDPLSAAELIQTSDTIKSQMKSVMGSNSSYVFDNQFSEAALFTASGVNLANNYFSFIGLSNGAYYMSQNVVGSPISKYDPYANAANQSQEEPNQEMQQEDNIQQPEQQESVMSNQSQEENSNTTDPILPNINISESADEQISNNIAKEDTQVDQEISSVGNDNIDGILPNINNSQGETTENKEETSIPKEKIKLNISDDSTDSDNISETPDEKQEEKVESNENEEQISDNNIENADLDIENNQTPEKTNEQVMENDNQYNEDITQELSNENNYEDDNQGIINETSNEENTENVDYQNNEQFEETATPTEEYNDYEENIEDQINNPVIINATNTIKKLLEENRKQRQIIDRQEGEIETLNSTNEILKEDNSEKTQEIISLRKAMSKYRSDNTELTRENNHLKSANSRQAEVIEHLKTQNTTLKEQVAGITALGNAVAEANTIFTPEKENDNNDLDSNIEFGYLGEDDGYQYTKKSA